MTAPGFAHRASARMDPADLEQLAESPVEARRVLALFAPDAGALVVVLIAVIAASIVGLAQPFLLRAVIDDALPHHDVGLLGLAVVGMICVAAATAVLGVLQTWLATTTGQRVMARMRTDVFAHVQRQSMAFFTRTRGGEIQSRLTNDVAGLQSVITTTATSVAANVTTAVGTAVAMVLLDWRLAVFALIVIPPALLIMRQVALIRRDVTAERQRTMADLHGQIDDALSVSGAMLTKTLGAEPERLATFTDTSDRLADLEVRSQLTGRWRVASVQMVFAIIPALVYLAAGFPSLLGNLTVGTVVAFAALATQIFRPLLGLLSMGAAWVSSLALLSRIFGYLDLPVEVPAPTDPVPLPAGAAGELRFDQVRYRYPDADTDALTGIDLVLRPGASLAVVGETGAGKSTLAALAVRLADPTSGRVLIDGVDARDLDPAALAGHLGVVTQETYLSHDTIRANLLRARSSATNADLWDALGDAQVADVVAALTDGLDTIVGARGHRFSGGERQRLAIARTILADPRILILDEATSALDRETERELQHALDRVSRGRTTLTIAHRLSTVEHADEIVVLERGSIVERGTHAELIGIGGRYAALQGLSPTD
ncbi:MAG: ABC transporter ATP-binding protein [Propioniciclava sp.]